MIDESYVLIIYNLKNIIYYLSYFIFVCYNFESLLNCYIWSYDTYDIWTKHIIIF